MKAMHDFSPTQLRRAAHLKEQIEKLQRQLERLLKIKAPPEACAVSKPARTKISAFAKTKIGAGQKARWTKIVKGRPIPPPPL
jgi:hypothetical protein